MPMHLKQPVYLDWDVDTKQSMAVLHPGSEPLGDTVLTQQQYGSQSSPHSMGWQYGVSADLHARNPLGSSVGIAGVIHHV